MTKEDVMQRSPLRDIALVIVVLLLGLLIIIGLHAFPMYGTTYSLAVPILGAFIFIFTGIRQIHKAQVRHQKMHWYMQPSILTGIGIFLGYPNELLGVGIIKLDPNISFIVEDVLLTCTVILLLLAVYFYFKGFRTNKREP